MSDDESKKARYTSPESDADPTADEPKSQDYSVGYRRPPVASRFKSRQSGNLSGRPRGTRTFESIMNELLSKRYEILNGGRARTISGLELLARTLFKKASTGDLKAIQSIIAMQTFFAKSRPVVERITSDMTAEEASKAYKRLIKGEL